MTESAATRTIRLVVAGDNENLRLMIPAVLRHAADIKTPGQAANGEEAVRRLQASLSDVVLMDVESMTVE